MIRQLFENWYSDGGKFPRAIERNGDGYKLKHAQDSWSSWQIAAAVTASKCADIAAEYDRRDPVHNIASAISDAIRKNFNISD